MARYLTPSKVSLLVLCSLYCSSIVPTSSTIPFLSFIVKKLHIVSEPAESDQDSSVSSPHDTVRSIALALDKRESSIPGRSLYDLFLSAIWDINSLDALHEFFAGLENILAKTVAEARRDAESGTTPPASEIRLARTSPMGVFVRRCQLEFTRLQFHDTMRLWTSFMQFKQLSAPDWRQRGHAITVDELDVNLREFEGEQSAQLLQTTYSNFGSRAREGTGHSLDDVERLLQFQVEKLQKYGTRVPPELMKQFEVVLRSSSSVPSVAYFVKFFEAWRAGDYTSAFDNLHRYFDYTMQAREKTYYQYALLHMAILQADFGCFDEAMASMTETIATARENQDMNCLNFSLSWLSHLRRLNPDAKNSNAGSVFGSERQALAFLKSKAKEGKMWSLLSSVLLGESKLELSQGGNTVRAFEHLYQSMYLSTIHHVQNSQGVLLLMQSAFFGRLGLDHISMAYAQLLIHSNQTGVPLEDQVRAVCRVAFAIAQRGRYDEALKLLASVQKEASRVLKLQQHITSYVGYVKAKRAIRRSDTIAAEHFLRAVSDPSITDPELDFNLRALSIELQTLNSSFAAALSTTEALLDTLRAQDADVFYLTSAQLLKVHILSQCGQAHRGLSLAMRAASVAYKSRIMPLLWDAMGAIAEILVEGEEYRAAQQVLQVIIPQAIEGGDSGLCATLCSIEADAWVGIAGEVDDKEKENAQMKALSSARRSLERALDYYAKTEDAHGQTQTFTKMAMIAMLRGERDAADDFAQKYTAERSFQISRIHSEG